ncbi:MAG TPA: TlpA disulfide reductase family protein [Fontimonas sp.]
MRSLLIVLALALLSGLGGFAAYHWLVRPQVVVGTVAPAIVMTDTDGQAHALAAYQGRWVLINFWASWCAPCMEELPLLVAAQQRFADRGLQVLGPALDEREPVLAAVKHFGINYPVSADFTGASAAMEALGNQRGALPYSVLLDPQGQIAETVLGALTAESLETLLTSKLPPSAQIR